MQKDIGVGYNHNTTIDLKASNRGADGVPIDSLAEPVPSESLSHALILKRLFDSR